MGKKILIVFGLITAAFLMAGCVKQQANQDVNINLYNQKSVIEEQNNLKQEIEQEGEVPEAEETNIATAVPEKIKNPVATVTTNQGVLKIELFRADAPKTVANFIKLAQDGFYDGTKFHRVIKNFMIQGGDPLSKDNDWSDDGTGGPGYEFEDEINSHKLVKGIIAMANRGPNTNGSQFFIVTAPETPWLDGLHTAFGKIVEGISVIDKIENVETNANDHPIEDMTITGIGIE